MEENAEGQVCSNWCAAVAVALGALHTMTVIGMAYQVPWVDYDQLVGFSVWLAPVIALLLYRRVCVLVCTFAVPLCVIFSARLYSIYLQVSQGIDTGGQKGDWAWWMTTIVGMLSVAIVAFWILLTVVTLFNELAASHSHRKAKD